MTGEPPRAYVRLIDPARQDLEALERVDPQIVRMVLKRLLLLERDPLAGEPLLGDLIGWRKLVVGDRSWRVVWRTTSDDSGGEVVEIAEVWAAGAREDSEIYAEVTARINELGNTPQSIALAEVIETLGKHAGGVSAATQPTVDPVPDWLVERLVHTAGLNHDRVVGLTGEEAMRLWEAHITGQGPPG